MSPLVLMIGTENESKKKDVFLTALPIKMEADLCLE
jgi:hypothetical protein